MFRRHAHAPAGATQGFRDRKDAENKLAQQLKQMNLGQEEPKPVVFALPRGGVPVAFPVAKELQAPLDVLVVRKVS